MVYFVARREPITEKQIPRNVRQKTTKLFFSVKTRVVNQYDWIELFFCAVTPLNKKKAISNHVIKGALVFQYASGSKDSYRRHIREDPGNEVERFLESEQG